MTEPNEVELTLAKVVEHDEKTKRLQSKLLLQYDDEVADQKGLDRLLAMSRYAIVFGRLWQMMTKQAAIAKDTVVNSGIQISVSEDVPMEKLTEMMAVPLSPKRDRNLEIRPIPDVHFDLPTQQPGTVL